MRYEQRAFKIKDILECLARNSAEARLWKDGAPADTIEDFHERLRANGANAVEIGSSTPISEARHNRNAQFERATTPTDTLTFLALIVPSNEQEELLGLVELRADALSRLPRWQRRVAFGFLTLDAIRMILSAWIDVIRSLFP